MSFLSRSQKDDILSVESDSSSSSTSSCASVSASASDDSNDKLDMLFEHCHWYDIPCPYPQCYKSNVRFDCHDKFKLHHEQCHCPRGENGDINRAKDSLRWQCPVETMSCIDGKEVQMRCNKISNSWYNYAGHITSHKEIGHGWGCALKPAGKRKKTNIKRNVLNHKSGKIIKMTVCGKRTSTKHHLLAHMANVHKTYNVIDTHGRQYNKKKDRRKSSNKHHKTRSMSGKKRKFREIDIDKECLLMKVNKKSHTNATSLLQMPLPSFQALQSLPSMHAIPHFPNLFTPKAHELPLLMNGLMPIQRQTISPLKKMRIHASDAKLWRATEETQFKHARSQRDQFNFLSMLCKAATAHKGCTKCCFDVEDEIEASLPSLSTYASASNSIHSQSSGSSPPATGSISDDTSTTTNNLSVPKLPQLPSLALNSTHFAATITKNVPFTFDLNQLKCSTNNAATAQTPFLKQNVITTAIPSLPAHAFTSTRNNFNGL